MAHRFNPDHADRLLSRERRESLPPERVLEHLRLTADASLADVGVGPGYFALPAARLTRGAVYGIDVQPRMLELVRAAAADAGLDNFVALAGDAEAIPLPDAAVDCVLCAFVLHEVADLARALRELRRIAKPRGRIALAEWEKIESPAGPPLSARLERAVLERAAQEAGFARVEASDLNPYQYLLACDR